MKKLAKIKVGGTSTRQDVLQEYLLDKRVSFSSDKMDYGRLVHSWCLDYDSFVNKLNVVPNNVEASIYEINNKITLNANSIDINETLYNTLEELRKSYLEAYETATCITLDPTYVYTPHPEEECVSDKLYVKTAKVDETLFSIEYEIRGRLDLYLISKCKTKAVLLDIKTNSIDSIKKNAVLPSLLKRYKSQMYHYSYLLHKLYPELKCLKVCLIVLRTKENKIARWDVEVYDDDFSKENCITLMDDKINKLHTWFVEEHLSLPYSDRMSAYKKTILDGESYSVGKGGGAEEVSGTEIKTMLNDNLQLMKLTSDQNTSSPLTYPDEYNRKVAEICTIYTSSTGSKINAISEMEMNKIKPCIYIAIARGYSLTSSKPDCYIFPLKNFYIVYQSYHYVERKLRENGYDIEVLFAKESDFPNNITIDMMTNETTINVNSPGDLARFNRDGCMDFDYCLGIVYKNNKQVKTFVYTKETILKYSKTYKGEGAWVTHLYEMCRKTCIKKVVSQFGELANLIQQTDVCDAIWGKKKEIIINQPAN